MSPSSGWQSQKVLWRKCLQESLLLLLACCIGLFVVGWTRAWVVASFDASKFSQIVELLPKEIKQLIPVEYAWLITYTGRVGLTFEEPVVFLCLGVWCIARGSDVVSGELSRGSLELLLAQPISRARIMWTHATVTLGGVGLITLSLWLGICAGVYSFSAKEVSRPSLQIPMTSISIPLPGKEMTTTFPLSERIDVSCFLPACLNLAVCSGFVAGLSMLLSACDRYRWRTIGLMTGFYVVQILMAVICTVSPRFSWLSWMTLFSAFRPSYYASLADRSPDRLWEWVVWQEDGSWKELGTIPLHLLLIVYTLALIWSASRVFHRRDVPAPL
jgi:ABC-2 type transport system permease protein